MKKVMVFGVFDNLHKGHLSFLEQAKSLGTHLTVCVAQDDVVEELKGKRPDQTIQQREKALRELDLVDQVAQGDHNIGTYRCIPALEPDIIAFGYDQDALRNDLETWLVQHKRTMDLQVMKPFKPEIYKSSKLRTTEVYD